jgi:hypothetical protein
MLPAKKIDRLLVANPTNWQGFSLLFDAQKCINATTPTIRLNWHGDCLE